MNETQGKPVKWWPTMVGFALPYAGYGAYTLYQNRQRQQRQARIARQVQEDQRRHQVMRRAERHARYQQFVPTPWSMVDLGPQHSQADIQAHLRQREAEL